MGRFEEYEFHFETNHKLSELVDKLKDMGYKVLMDLVEGEEGVKLHVMNGNGSYIPVMVDLCEEENGSYEYEMKFANREDFMKVHDIMSNL